MQTLSAPHGLAGGDGSESRGLTALLCWSLTFPTPCLFRFKQLIRRQPQSPSQSVRRLQSPPPGSPDRKMGNSSSSARGHHDDTVDFGSLVSQGVYTGPQDWNQAIVAQLIVQRKLAPFYRPLEEYDESWDDEQILASRKELPENTETASHSETASATSSSKPDVGSSFRSHGKRPSAQKEAAKFSEAVVYRGAVECPICFLVRLVYNLSMLVRLTRFFFLSF